MKAWANLARYEAGTNLRAWLFTILRNTFYSEHRKHRLEIEDADGHLAAGLSTPARQNDHMDFEDFRVALQQLAPDQREPVQHGPKVRAAGRIVLTRRGRLLADTVTRMLTE